MTLSRLKEELKHENYEDKERILIIKLLDVNEGRKYPPQQLRVPKVSFCL